MKIKSIIARLKARFFKAASIAPVNTRLYQGQAMISFAYDDGQKSNFENALPLHAQFNIAAGFAVIAGRMQGDAFRKRYMESWQVQAASKRGIEIYSHSLTHKRLTGMSAVEIDRELYESKALLEKTIGQAVTSICIPFSAANEEIITAASRYYQHIRVHGRKFTELQSKDKMIYAFGLKNDTRFDEVKEIIDRAIAEKYWVTLMLHGVIKGAEKPENAYDVNTHLLQKILAYVQEVGADKILPVNFSDVEKIRKSSGLSPRG